MHYITNLDLICLSKSIESSDGTCLLLALHREHMFFTNFCEGVISFSCIVYHRDRASWHLSSRSVTQIELVYKF